MDYIHHYDSPLGSITMASDGTSLKGLWFDGQAHFGSTLSPEHKEKMLPVFAQTDQWLDSYFSGKIPNFTPPLSVRSTPFREAVWTYLLTIPYGYTVTYGQIADILADKRGIAKMSAQAVGSAVGHNPIGLIIPCHRVMGCKGKLTGYAAGVDKKAWLLILEKQSTT